MHRYYRWLLKAIVHPGLLVEPCIVATKPIGKTSMRRSHIGSKFKAPKRKVAVVERYIYIYIYVMLCCEGLLLGKLNLQCFDYIESDENIQPNAAVTSVTGCDAGSLSRGQSHLASCWKIIFAKSHLKRRCFSDGFLVLSDNGRHYFLRDGTQTLLGKLTADPATVQIDAEFEVGPYIVQVEHPTEQVIKSPASTKMKKKTNAVEEVEPDESSHVNLKTGMTRPLQQRKQRHSVANAARTPAVRTM